MREQQNFATDHCSLITDHEDGNGTTTKTHRCVRRHRIRRLAEPISRQYYSGSSRTRVWPHHRRAWHIARPLDLKVMKAAAKHFVGTHDFAGFAANRGKAENSTIRTIYSVRIRQKAACITIDFYGDGFLYKMVRLIVGALVKCALGKMRTEDVVARLESGQLGPARFAAPAEGLFLVRVRY